MPRSKSQHKQEELQERASRINLTCCSDAEERKGKKAKRTHLLRGGGGGFLTIDRNLLLNSNRKHLTIPQSASTSTTSTSSRRCKSRETQLISSRLRKVTRARRNKKFKTLTLIHCLHTILQNPNPNLYFKI